MATYPSSSWTSHRKKPDDVYDGPKDYEGIPYCKNGFPMVPTGFDGKIREVIYRCPEMSGDATGRRLDTKFADAEGEIARIRVAEDH